MLWFFIKVTNNYKNSLSVLCQWSVTCMFLGFWRLSIVYIPNIIQYFWNWACFHSWVKMWGWVD